MTLRRKLWSFFAVLAALVAMPTLALAQSPEASDAKSGWGLAIGAALVVGLAAFGGTTAQGRATASALEGIARQPSAAPRITTPLILGLAMIESLVLFAWAMGYLLLGKIGG
jgi:F-type H+-transporting ATPase subunit c